MLDIKFVRESKELLRAALANRKGPTALILTRQNLPRLDSTVAQTLSGGYVLAEALRDGQPVEPDVILIGTGS